MNNAQNNPKTAHWQALSQAHHLAPFSDYKQLAEKARASLKRRCACGTARATRSSMAWPGLWCVAVGYGREELVAAASKQMLQLPFYNASLLTRQCWNWRMPSRSWRQLA